MMLRSVLALAVLLGAVAQADRTLAEFRLNKDPGSPMRGWIVSFDQEGFRFERFGGGSRVRIPWEDLVAEDARRLRIELGLELTEDERLGLIPGHILHFKGGGEVRGVLERVDEDGRHWLRSGGLILPYPADRIERVEEAKVKEDEVYSPDEVYIRKLERRPPRTAEEHRRLGDYLFDIGSFEGAREQYEQAVAMDPGLRPRLAARMEEIRDYMQDREAAAAFAKAKKLANLDGRFADAIALVENYTKAHPGARRRGLQLVEELEKRRLEKRQALFHRVKGEEFDRAIDRFLLRKKPDLSTAKSWVTGLLKDELRKRITKRLELSEEEWELFSKTRAKGAPHWATYWSGSFIVNQRVPKGKSTKRQRRGDPDRWWATYSDIETRSSWLKAYAVERLPDLFEIVQVRTSPCEKCGGTGRVRHMSLNALKDGRHEWVELCPRCFGAGTDRAIAYR